MAFIKRLLSRMILTWGICNLFFICWTVKLDKNSKENTLALSVTVMDMKTYSEAENSQLLIFTQEYDNAFSIESDIIQDDFAEYELLKEKNVTIYIRESQKNQLNNVSYLDCVSLESQTEIFYSFEEYNESVRARKKASMEMLLTTETILVISYLCLRKTGRKA